MKLWLAVMTLIMFSVALPAHAACTLSGGASASFGTQSSFIINTTSQNTSSSFTVACSVVLNLLNVSDTVKLTLVSAVPVAATGARPALYRTDVPTNPDNLPVRVCGLANCASNSEITVGNSFTWGGATLLGLLTNTTYTLPVFFYSVAGQNLSAGPYQVALTFRVDWNICSLSAVACVTYQTGFGSLAPTLTLNVTNDCITISAPNVNFNSAPLVQNFPTVSQTVAVTCTKGSAYTVGLNNGVNASGSVRRMANSGGSSFMSYEIYKSNGTDRWGSSGAERWSSTTSTSVSTDGLLRNFSYVAKVLTTQTTPAAGAYSDTLIVDVSF